MFLFSKEWQEYEKTAVFWQHRSKRYEMALDELDSCLIPKEAQLEDGFIFIGIIGRKGDVLMTSKVFLLPINEGVEEGNLETAITQPLYDQMINKMSDLLLLAENAVQEAKDVAVKTPYIGENGNWYVYSFEDKIFRDSGVYAGKKEE